MAFGTVECIRNAHSQVRGMLCLAAHRQLAAHDLAHALPAHRT